MRNCSHNKIVCIKYDTARLNGLNIYQSSGKDNLDNCIANISKSGNWKSTAVISVPSSLIIIISFLPKLHLTRYSITDFLLHIIKVLYDLTLVDEPAKPVGAMAVREMKIIPDKVGVVRLAFLNLSIGIEVGDSQGVGVQSPQRNVFLFQGVVCGLFTLISAHKNILLLIPARSSKGHEEF